MGSDQLGTTMLDLFDGSADFAPVVFPTLLHVEDGGGFCFCQVGPAVVAAFDGHNSTPKSMPRSERNQSRVRLGSRCARLRSHICEAG